MWRLRYTTKNSPNYHYHFQDPNSLAFCDNKKKIKYPNHTSKTVIDHCFICHTTLPRPSLQGQVSPALLLVVTLLSVSHRQRSTIGHTLGLLLWNTTSCLLWPLALRRGGGGGLLIVWTAGAGLAVLHQDGNGHSTRRTGRLKIK